MIPVAPTTAEWVERVRGPYWRLTVADCPYCHRKHVHGGGSGPEPSYGHRSVHCWGEAAKLPETGAGYVLAPA